MSDSFRLLPFEFKRKTNGEVLLVNECGDFLCVSPDEFRTLVEKRFEDLPQSTLHRLENRHIVAEEKHFHTALNLLGNKYRSRREYLFSSTALHMLVVTLRCNHKCEYCQVSSREEDAYKYDMKPEVAEKIVDLVFESPSPVVKIEFQGGDALLNWPTVMAAVRHAEKLNVEKKKELEFVICTNLYALEEGHIADIKEHKINISTSLDGPCWMHDKHRILRTEGSSYKMFAKKLALARKHLGHGCANALMTTTVDSLDNIEAIIDEYVSLGFEGIFFRALNPYGDAHKNNLYYSPERYFEMYKRGLEYIIDLNKKGKRFVEYYTALLIRRIMSPYATGFVDLQSPSGAGISGVIYDYTGDVYPADEARMLSRMGDCRFKMGNVYENSFKEIFLSDVLKKIVRESCVETIPGCSSCAYRTYCGVDVFRNYLETGDISNVRMDSFFCRKQTQIFDYLFERICDSDFIDVVGKWIGG